MTMNAGAFLNRKIREYLLTDIIGVGGMGAVFKAYHVRLKTTRAVKVLRPDMKADPSFKARFEQEARILARLENPHLIRIYEFFEEEDHLFLIMEYVRGESLADRMEYRGILPPEQAVDLIRQACEGLSHAHAQGIVHRDLSPDNLMITSMPEGGEILKVIDFGIAKRITIQAEFKTLIPDALTTPGVFIGKVKYCSPEQAMGKTLDHRSDQYSLALILYESITGRHAFEAETPMESLTIRLHKPPPKLSEVRSGSSYPSELEHVIMKAMDKDPEKRFPTTMDFSRALEEALKKDITEDIQFNDNILTSFENGNEEPGEEGEVLEIPENDSQGTIVHSKVDVMNLSEALEERPRQYQTDVPPPPPPMRPAYRQKPQTNTVKAIAPPRKASSRSTWLFLLVTGCITGGIIVLLLSHEKTPSDIWFHLKKSIFSNMLEKKQNILPTPSPKIRNGAVFKHKSSTSFKPASGDGPFLATRPGVVPPVILKKVEPPHPPFDPDITLPATVIVEVVILKTGKIGTIDIIKSISPEYDALAVNVVKQWRFKGGTLNGKPADIIVDIPVKFQ